MIIHIDMDGVISDFQSAKKAALKAHPSILEPHLEYGFYMSLAPIKDAISSVQYLIEETPHDIYILTAPAVRNPASYIEKRLWIEKYFNTELARKLIISPNKGLLKGDILIDDHQTGWGQQHFEGQLYHFGGADYPDWSSILNQLK